MARITIEFDTATETLSEVLERLTPYVSYDRRTPGVNAPPMVENIKASLDALTDQDAEPGERTRFKRTRDEIARGLTVEQAKAERAGTTSASPAASGPSTEKSDPSKKTESSSGETTVDPFAEPPTTPTASPTTSDALQGRALTLQDLRGAMSAYLAKNDDAGAMQSLMAAHFKTEEGEPVMRASQLQTKDYAAAIELLSA